MAANKYAEGNFRLRASVCTRIRTGISAYRPHSVRTPVVAVNNLVNQDAKVTIAIASVIRGGCPFRVGCKTNETNKSASRRTKYQFYPWAHHQQFTVTVTEKFSTSNASIVAKWPGSRVHSNYPGSATESERHPSVPRKMRTFRLPELHFKNSSRFHANLRAREAWDATC
jgi:hypothetical protein